MRGGAGIREILNNFPRPEGSARSPAVRRPPNVDAGARSGGRGQPLPASLADALRTRLPGGHERPTAMTRPRPPSLRRACRPQRVTLPVAPTARLAHRSRATENQSWRRSPLVDLRHPARAAQRTRGMRPEIPRGNAGRREKENVVQRASSDNSICRLTLRGNAARAR